MTTIAGVDGCKTGWFAILEEIPARQLGSKIFPTISDLTKHLAQFAVVAIDIPIGLTDAGPRACDVAARKLLRGARASSVFPAPIRPAIAAGTYEEACERSFAAQGKKLPKQSWAIYPKIRELDSALRAHPEWCNTIFEVHPEVSFCAWNSMAAFAEPKRSAEGAAGRRALVDAHFGPTAYDRIRSRYKRSEVADDDILDAFAALWTAERIQEGRAAQLPAEKITDNAGLPMRMVY